VKQSITQHIREYDERMLRDERRFKLSTDIFMMLLQSNIDRPQRSKFPISEVRTTAIENADAFLAAYYGDKP